MANTDVRFPNSFEGQRESGPVLKSLLTGSPVNKDTGLGLEVYGGKQI